MAQEMSLSLIILLRKETPLALVLKVFPSFYLMLIEYVMYMGSNQDVWSWFCLFQSLEFVCDKIVKSKMKN
jgi:hypothetical protein